MEREAQEGDGEKSGRSKNDAESNKTSKVEVEGSEETINVKDSAVAKLMQPTSDRMSDEEEVEEEKDNAPEEPVSTETVDFKVVFNKTKYNITWKLDKTVLSLKHHIQTLTTVAPAMQKLMFKGLAKDEKTLRELGVTNGSKMMVIGSKLKDVISIDAVTPSTSTSEESSATKKEPLSQQKPHSKVIEKGMPDDAMPGYVNGREGLPLTPLKGMINKHGNKVRLTFKLESDQLWLGTKERTEKLPLNSIKDVISEKMQGYEGYHMMALQLGPTEQSRYWIYWVPSQYVEAIKDAILGKWQFY